jgi:NNP family nitrate/nitrite transporter-like MFS transporter
MSTPVLEQTETVAIPVATGTPHGTPGGALFAATVGFFAGFAAVSLFGPMAARFQAVMHLGPERIGLLVAAPALSGALLRIPFSAWVDTTGGRRPFLVLLSLAIAGMAGLSALIYYFYPAHLTPRLYPVLLLSGVLSGCGIATFSVGISQVSYWFTPATHGRALGTFGGVGNLAPGIFSFLLPIALVKFGLAGSYLGWLLLLNLGTVIYALRGRNAWYFELRAKGIAREEAKQMAADRGQVLMPTGNLTASLRLSARAWKTWALVLIYFTTFGGFVALTAWLPVYWHSFFGFSLIRAGMAAALFSILASLTRVAGGAVADQLREGGENTAILALLIALAGALVMTNAARIELAFPGEVLLAIGMGLSNAAVFKLVPQEVPQAVGGAAGWVGGLGALGGFAIPPVLGCAVREAGKPGYAVGFVVFIFLALLSFAMAWVLKYSRRGPA